MTTCFRLASVAAITLGLIGCNATDKPTATAFSRNVGPGSSVTGTPQSDMGANVSGVPRVPGAPSAGTNPTGGN